MRSNQVLLPLSALLFANAALCQSTAGTIVSPVSVAATEGNDANLFPFADETPRRYQQIHGDIGGGVKFITKLSFRMNANTVNFTSTRVIDLEMWMGSGRFVSQASFVFAQNYIGVPVLTIARKVVNMGPQGQAVEPGPNEFNSNMDLVLDAPFGYSGSTALTWELAVYSNTLTGLRFNAADAEMGSGDVARTVVTGVGCLATGRVEPMTHVPTYTDRGGIFVANNEVMNGPSNAPTLLSLGSSNPNMRLPGYCSNAYTDGIVIVAIGITNAAGAITENMAGTSTFVVPNNVGGATLFSQAHSLDPSRPDPVKLTNSNGRSGVVPAKNTANVVNVARIYNNVGGTSALEGVFFPEFNIGYGLVTQFTF